MLLRLKCDPSPPTSAGGLARYYQLRCEKNRGKAGLANFRPLKDDGKDKGVNPRATGRFDAWTYFWGDAAGTGLVVGAAAAGASRALTQRVTAT